jgi:hypothetical protein
MVDEAKDLQVHGFVHRQKCDSYPPSKHEGRRNNSTSADTIKSAEKLQFANVESIQILREKQFELVLQTAHIKVVQHKLEPSMEKLQQRELGSQHKEPTQTDLEHAVRLLNGTLQSCITGIFLC